MVRKSGSKGARAGKSNPSPRAICTLFYFTFISREPTLFHICRLHLTFAPHASFQYTIFHSILSSFAFYQVTGPCSNVEFCQTKRRHWRVQHSTNLCIINDDLTQYKTDSRQRKSGYLWEFIILQIFCHIIFMLEQIKIRHCSFMTAAKGDHCYSDKT